MFSASLLLIPVTFFTVGYDFSQVQTSGIVALGYAGIVGAFFAFILALYILQRFGAPGLSLTAYVIPVVTTILGVIFLDENVTPTMLISMLIIFLGIALLNYQPKMAREGHVRP
jgi:drug/metabolite transporter (DMT)-like permease